MRFRPFRYSTMSVVIVGTVRVAVSGVGLVFMAVTVGVFVAAVVAVGVYFFFYFFCTVLDVYFGYVVVI